MSDARDLFIILSIAPFIVVIPNFYYYYYYLQLSQDGQTPTDRRSSTPGGVDVDEDEDGASRSASKTPPPPKEGGVRVSVTSPPGLLSSPAVGSVISPFGSPSTWISEDQHGATADTSNVRINGDHVTQVRVDALVLESHHPVAAAASAVPAEEDRDQSELVVSPRGSGSKDHVTAVQVEHTTSISQPP